MTVLGIDTAARVGGVAVVSDGRLSGSATFGVEESHSEVILPAVDGLLRQLGLSLESVDAISVCIGPGSFTGLRIGLAAVKGMAYARGVPVVGISTLLATAWGFSGVDAILCPALDARRGKVYAALYDGATLPEDRSPLAPEGRVDVLELAETLAAWNRRGRDVIVLGDGADVVWGRLPSASRGPERIEPEVGCVRRMPMNGEAGRPANLAHLGEIEFRQGRREDLVELVPNYLRLSEAERRWKQKPS